MITHDNKFDVCFRPMGFIKYDMKQPSKSMKSNCDSSLARALPLPLAVLKDMIPLSSNLDRLFTNAYTVLMLDTG